MKKSIIILGIAFFCFGYALHVSEVSAIYRPGWAYWDYWKTSFTKLKPKQNEKTKQRTVYEKYPYRYFKGYKTKERQLRIRRPWNFSGIERPQVTKYVQGNAEKVPNIKQTDSFERLRESFAQQYIQTANSVLVNVRPLTQKEPITTINNDLHKVFHVGMTNTIQPQRSRVPQAVLLESMTFQMFSNTGIAENPEDFELVINGESAFSFGHDGKVSVEFQNARMAYKESLELDIAIRIKNPDLTPHVPGSFRMRVYSINLIQEQGRDSIHAFLSGKTISEYIAFDPVGSQPSSSAGINAQKQTIEGRTLSAGEKAYVLSMSLEAHSDDFLLREVIIKDTLSLGDIDVFSDSIRAVSARTGITLGTGRFVNGLAKIRFSNPLKIYRNGERQEIFFEIQLDDKIRTNNNTFRLEVDPRDIWVTSNSTGRDLPDTQKNVSIESDIFKVAESGGKVFVTTDINQPESLSILPTSPTSVFRFRIVNNDAREISLFRLSLDVQFNGLQFAGGRSVDDFELKRLYRGREVDSGFIPTLGSGNVVIFDASAEVYIPRETSMEFVLKLKMEDIVSGKSKYDTVLVNVLGDSSSSRGTINDLKTTNANFIWSDQSGRPHSFTSDDWVSGYLMNGLPSGFVPVYRR